MSAAKENHHAGIRQSILEAARSLLVERSPEAFSLRELARQLDCSRAGLFEFFGIKREIVDPIRGAGEEQLERRPARVDPAPDSGAHLIALVHGLAAPWPREAAADAAPLEAAGDRATALLIAGLERPQQR